MPIRKQPKASGCAANAFADYAASDIAKLSELLTAATPEQYAVLYPIVAASPAPATVEQLGTIAATAPPLELGSVQHVAFGQRRANAAVTLLRLGERQKVLRVFEVTDDPEALTQFIFRCRPRGVGCGPAPGLLADREPVRSSATRARSVRAVAGAGGIQFGGNPRSASGNTAETTGELASK